MLFVDAKIPGLKSRSATIEADLQLWVSQLTLLTDLRESLKHNNCSTYEKAFQSINTIDTHNLVQSQG